jgi:hypothetical protein
MGSVDMILEPDRILVLVIADRTLIGSSPLGFLRSLVRSDVWKKLTVMRRCSILGNRKECLETAINNQIDTKNYMNKVWWGLTSEKINNFEMGFYFRKPQRIQKLIAINVSIHRNGDVDWTDVWSSLTSEKTNNF